ncbi:MAG TPA: glycosyltransferase [Candidatus Saccharimonadales bacterium]|nr:glycosyltransferase [Candidatus Saccharimonadales bacterium]
MTRARTLVASIIIVVKNDRGIDQTIAGIYDCAFSGAFEIVVVDSSEPARLGDIRAKYPDVVWDQYPVSNRRTTPEQRNRGLELARGKYIIFIDANCVPAKTWLSAMVETLQDGKDIVCGPVHDLNETNLVHYAVEQTKADYVEECTTINVGLSRRVIEKVGNFDVRFSFGQDVDFFWRTADVGFRIFYNPLVAIGHDWGSRGEQLGRAYKYGYARARLFRKHWRRHGRQLLGEVHVWMYPAFILGLPSMLLFELNPLFLLYPLLILVPLLKNRTANPLGLMVHHMTFGWGVLRGAVSRL